jgi:hypothetical protein
MSIFRKWRATFMMPPPGSSISPSPNLDEFATFVGNLGRKQPAAVAAAAFLLVVGLAWFLKSSSDMSGRSMADEREGGAYGMP